MMHILNFNFICIGDDDVYKQYEELLGIIEEVASSK